MNTESVFAAVYVTPVVEVVFVEVEQGFVGSISIEDVGERQPDLDW